MTIGRYVRLLFWLVMTALLFTVLWIHGAHAQTNLGPIRTPQVTVGNVTAPNMIFLTKPADGDSGLITFNGNTSTGYFGIAANAPAGSFWIQNTLTGTDTFSFYSTTGTATPLLVNQYGINVTNLNASGNAVITGSLVCTGTPCGTVGASIAHTTNLIAGDNNGNGVDSGVAASNIPRLNALNIFQSDGEAITIQGSANGYPTYVLQSPTQKWGWGMGGTGTPFYDDMFFKNLNTNAPVFQVNATDDAFTFWSYGGISGNLAVNAGGYELFCPSSIALCVNNTTGAGQPVHPTFSVDTSGNAVLQNFTAGVNGGFRLTNTTVAPNNWYSLTFNGNIQDGQRLGFVADQSGANGNLYTDVPANGNFLYRVNNATIFTLGANSLSFYNTATIASNGDTHVHTLTCDTTPCGSGGGGGGVIPVTSNLLAGDGAGGARDTGIQNVTGVSTTFPGTMAAGYNGTVQFASGGTYNNFTFNGNNNNGTRLGFVADGSGGNPSLYLDTPANGQFIFRNNNNVVTAISATGNLSVASASCTAGLFCVGASPVKFNVDGGGNVNASNSIAAGQYPNAPFLAMSIEGNTMAPAVPGLTIGWNHHSSSETDLINTASVGTGGFALYNSPPGTVIANVNPIMTIDANANMRLGSAANASMMASTGEPGAWTSALTAGVGTIVTDLGARMHWNNTQNFGETDFTNIKPAGIGAPGGYNWYDVEQGTQPTTPIARLDGSGNLNTASSVSAGTAATTLVTLLWAQGPVVPTTQGSIHTWNQMGQAETDFVNAPPEHGFVGGFRWFDVALGATVPTYQPLMTLDAAGDLYVTGNVYPYSTGPSSPSRLAPPAATLSDRPLTSTGKPSAVVPNSPKKSRQVCRKNAMWHDDDYIYVCIASGNVKRAALASFQ